MRCSETSEENTIFCLIFYKLGEILSTYYFIEICLYYDDNDGSNLLKHNVTHSLSLLCVMVIIEHCLSSHTEGTGQREDGFACLSWQGKPVMKSPAAWAQVSVDEGSSWS